MQETSHLVKILDHSTLSSASILTFCSDQRDQILYITSSPSTVVELIMLSEAKAEDCFISVETTEEVKEKLDVGVTNLMKKFNSSQELRKQLTRQSTIFNIL